MKVTALVTDPEQAREMLERLGLPSVPPVIAASPLARCSVSRGRREARALGARSQRPTRTCALK